MFLDDEELFDLTGYRRNADRRRWLSDRKWKFETTVTGKPVVSRNYAESRLAGVVVKTEPQLNWAAVRG